MVGDFKETVFPRNNRADMGVNSVILRASLRICKIQLDKISAEMGGGGYTIPPLSEELLAFDKFWERENPFPLVM